MMQILLTNDDGIDAPGLQALCQAVPEGLEAVIVAPANQKSASSHSITLGEKLRVVETEARCPRAFAVHGTPADCVKIAISEIEGFMPDLIVSGINQGANTGVSVYYSGTISAAREGLINRIPSIALSLCSRTYGDFSVSVAIARRLIEGCAAGLLPKDIMLNVNVPPVPQEEINGIKITKQAASHFIEEFIPDKIHGNTRIYSLAGEIEIYNADGTSDEENVAKNYISITPLKIDLTDYTAMPFLERWLKEKP